MTWSCAFALDPHIRFFLGSMFSFQGSVSGFDKLLSSASTHHFTRSIYYKYYFTRSAWVSLNLSNFSLPVPSDFSFCFVAVSRRLVYNTTWPRLCQHFFRHFFEIFSWNTWIRVKINMLDYRIFRHQNFFKKPQKK